MDPADNGKPVRRPRGTLFIHTDWQTDANIAVVSHRKLFLILVDDYTFLPVLRNLLMIICLMKHLQTQPHQINSWGHHRLYCLVPEKKQGFYLKKTTTTSTTTGLMPCHPFPDHPRKFRNLNVRLCGHELSSSIRRPLLLVSQKLVHQSDQSGESPKSSLVDWITV